MIANRPAHRDIERSAGNCGQNQSRLPWIQAGSGRV